MTNLAFYRPVVLDSRSAAENICGKLSNPSKMPGPAYSVPATSCKVGGALHQVEGSVCRNCYALKGRYTFPNVRDAMARREASLYHPQWIEAIVYLISDSRCTHFRWHDSGDLQSLAHLLNIVRVAELLPAVKFWLPTREKAVVASYLRTFLAFPKNLVVRLSAAMVDSRPPSDFPNTSTVHKDAAPFGRACPAPSQGNACGSCRACWDRRVKNVSYHYH